MGVKYKDFDAMFSEMESETVSFKVYGKMYQIKKSMPASIVLELARQEKSGNIPTNFLFKAARLIFGEKILGEITSHPDFDVSKLGKLIKWAFEAINGSEDATDAEDEMTEDDVGDKKTKN